METRDGGDQPAKEVRRRRRQQGVGGAGLDDAASLHYGDAVRDGAHDGEVMADEEIGEAELLLQLHDKIEDARPDRGVERGDRLVEHDELRARRDGAGDRNALALPAGERRDRPPCEIGGQADLPQQRRYMLGPIATGGDLVDAQRLRNGAACRDARVEGGGRILEDHLHAPARPAQLRARQRQPLQAVEANLSCVRLDQTYEHAGERGFAAARGADQAERLSRPMASDAPSSARTRRGPP